MRGRAQNDGFVLYVQLCVLTVQNRHNYQELSLTPGRGELRRKRDIKRERAM